jgi:hypothetical protein
MLKQKKYYRFYQGVQHKATRTNQVNFKKADDAVDGIPFFLLRFALVIRIGDAQVARLYLVFHRLCSFFGLLFMNVF